MRKTKVIFKKTNGKLIPEHLSVYYEMLSQVREHDFIQAEYSDVKVGKSQEQLGYIFSCIYVHFLYWFKELQGPVLYEITIMGYTTPIKATIESVDVFMKGLYAKYKDEEVQKRNMSQAVMAEYIDFLDKWSIENFECPIPPPKYGDKNETQKGKV